MLENSCGSTFLFFSFFLFFFILGFKKLKKQMSDKTYGSDEFRVEFLHDERGKLIKGDSLFNNIYDFWVCIHVGL